MDRIISVSDAAWAAGFLDGEGCFSLRSGAGEGLFYAAIWANQTNLEPLEQLKELFSGSIYEQKRYNIRHKPVWVWTANGRNVEYVLNTIKPYSIVKKRQIELLLQFRALLGIRGQQISSVNTVERQNIYAELRFLNERGVA